MQCHFEAAPSIDDGVGTYSFETENPSPVPPCHIQEVQNSEEFFIASVLKTELQDLYCTRESRKLYSKVKETKKKFKPRVNICKAKDVLIICDQNKVLS
jgi:hypothetical protein